MSRIIVIVFVLVFVSSVPLFEDVSKTIESFELILKFHEKLKKTSFRLSEEYWERAIQVEIEGPIEETKNQTRKLIETIKEFHPANYANYEEFAQFIHDKNVDIQNITDVIFEKVIDERDAFGILVNLDDLKKSKLDDPLQHLQNVGIIEQISTQDVNKIKQGEKQPASGELEKLLEEFRNYAKLTTKKIRRGDIDIEEDENAKILKVAELSLSRKVTQSKENLTKYSIQLKRMREQIEERAQEVQTLINVKLTKVYDDFEKDMEALEDSLRTELHHLEEHLEPLRNEL